jgi:hypothetical protein
LELNDDYISLCESVPTLGVGEVDSSDEGYSVIGTDNDSVPPLEQGDEDSSEEEVHVNEEYLNWASTLEEGNEDMVSAEHSVSSDTLSGLPNLDSSTTRTFSEDSQSDWSTVTPSDQEVVDLQGAEPLFQSIPTEAPHQEEDLFADITERYLGSRLLVTDIQTQSSIMRLILRHCPQLN